MAANKTVKFIYGFGVLAALIMFYLFYDYTLIKKGPLDLVEKENPKISILFDSLLMKEIHQYESGWYEGCPPSAATRVKDFFKTIKQVETYVRFGTESSRSKNDILLRLELNNGTKKELDTGVDYYGGYG
ncbi:MAG: hypothetical protein ACRCYO_03960, partial [Bacteroidia bacterium]